MILRWVISLLGCYTMTWVKKNDGRDSRYKLLGRCETIKNVRRV